MTLSYNFLSEYLKLPKPEILKDKLIMLGLKVESLRKEGNDFIFDLEIVSNRPDLLSYIGITREIAAFLGEKYKLPKISYKENRENTGKYLKVKILNNNLCLRYAACLIKDVKVAPSPKWLKEKLEKSDIRSVNNVVDVTNYVMLEFGEPLHAFDYEKIKNREIIVRNAQDNNEELVTLDGQNRKLDKNMLVIADSQKPIALAGIMGGENSEVNEKTKTIVLEAATFFGPNIHKTSSKLGLRTEASERFEKGLDPNLAETGLNRACQLFQKICSGKILKGSFDTKKTEKPKTIKLDFSKVKKLLGLEIKKEKIIKILESLGFSLVRSSSRQLIYFTLPSWRNDIKIEEDLIEEIARIYGYDKIPKTLPKKLKAEELKEYQFVKNLKKILKDLGFFEVITYSFISKKDLKNLGENPKKTQRLINPLLLDWEYLRPSLLPSILNVIAKNPTEREFMIFEIGNIWPPAQSSAPEELLLQGRASGLAGKNGKERKQLILGFKGKSKNEIENIIKNLEKFKIKPSLLLHPVKKEILEKFKIRSKNVSIFIYDLEEIFPESKLPIKKLEFRLKDIKYKPVSKYPPISFDLAIVVGEGLNQNLIENIITESSGELLANLELFDVYTGPSIPSSKKSFAYHLTFSSYERTLKDEEIKKIKEKIIKNLRKIGAQIRGIDI